MFASATEPEAVADSDVESRHTGPRLIANRIRGVYWTMMHRHELGRAGITVQFTDGVSHKGRGGFVADALTAVWQRVSRQQIDGCSDIYQPNSQPDPNRIRPQDLPMSTG